MATRGRDAKNIVACAQLYAVVLMLYFMCLACPGPVTRVGDWTKSRNYREHRGRERRVPRLRSANHGGNMLQSQQNQQLKAQIVDDQRSVTAIVCSKKITSYLPYTVMGTRYKEGHYICIAFFNNKIK